MVSHVARAGFFEQIVVDAFAVDVVHEHRIAILFGPIIAQINHRPAVRMPAASGVFLMGSQTISDILLADKMQMVRDRIDSGIGILTRGTISPRFIVSALNHMKKMWVNAIAHEPFAEIVPVNSPWVGGSVRVGFPLMANGMIPIDAAVKLLALVVARSRFADSRPIGSSMRAVQPSIRPPCKTVG